MPYKVTIKRSGHSFECPEDSSVLAAGLKAGYMLPYNCRSGLCRTCKALVLEGEVHYQDKPLGNYLSPADIEQGNALLCQARACSDLVIDAREDTRPRNHRADQPAVPHHRDCAPRR